MKVTQKSKNYSSPEITLISWNENDVVRTSAGSEFPDDWDPTGDGN